MLCTLHIVVCGSQKLGYHALNVIADIARFRQGGGVGQCQRHIQESGQSLYQISFSASGRTDHQHIGFLDLHTVGCIRVNSLIMVIYSHRYGFFGMFLPDHILIQSGFDLMGSRQLTNIEGSFRLILWFFLFKPLSFGYLVGNIAKVHHGKALHSCQQIIVIDAAVVHGIKALLHAVCADTDIIWQRDHTFYLTLRSAAEHTDFFVCIFFICCILILYFVFRHLLSSCVPWYLYSK